MLTLKRGIGIWLADSRRLLAMATIIALLAGVCALVYEPLPDGQLHMNRLTLAICSINESCWF